MAIDERFYFVKVNPHAGKDGITGTLIKATELENALSNIGLACKVDSEKRAGRVRQNYILGQAEEGE